MTQLHFNPTKEQRAVILHDGSAFVTACPGAGKTRLLTERARLLFQGLPQGRGLAFLSFTQAAVSEIEERLSIEELLPTPVFPSFVGTFDSFVWQFLIAPFGIKGSADRPSLIPDIADTPVEPFTGAHRLPLSCFSPDTGEIYQHAAKSQGFDISKKPDHQIRAYVTAASRIRNGFCERGQLDFDAARRVALDRIEDHAFSELLGAALRSRFWSLLSMRLKTVIRMI